MSIEHVYRHGSVALQVRQIVLHDSFQGNDDFQADIALISLESKAELSPDVLPACFSPDVDFIEKGVVGEVQ
jgi:hypothetical protein